MTILDRKPVKYSTSDLIWDPSPAPTDGTVGDMNTMKLDPSHLGFAQDVILSKDGTLRSRGSVNLAAPQHTGQPLALVQSGANTGMVSYDTTNFNSLYASSTGLLTTWQHLAVLGEDSSSSSQKLTAPNLLYRWDGLKLAANQQGIISPGAIFTGASFANPGSPSVSSSIWGGSLITTNNATGTLNAYAQGATTITGTGTAWTSALIGAYLYDNGTVASPRYLGQVKAVASTTSLTLVEGAQSTSGGTPAMFFKAARLMHADVYKGFITCTTGSTTVVGANTKFASSGPNKGSIAGYLSAASSVSGAWQVFRQSDGAFVGLVNSVQNDTTLTLVSNAAINMTNERYVIRAGIPIGGFNMYQANYFGAGCAEVYSDRYWYGCFYANDVNISLPQSNTDPRIWCSSPNPSSICFSNKFNPEQLDLSATTGDILTLPSVSGQGDEVRALKAVQNGMLIFRGADTYFLTGYSPETFRTVKILDDGIMGANCLKKYNEGIIWAGYKSIWYFDGSKVIDLLQNKVKDFYSRTVAFVGTTDCGAAISNDHFLFSYNFPGSTTWPYKNTTVSALGMTIAINMVNGAISFFTNLFVYNSLDILISTTFTPVLLGGGGNTLAATTGQFFTGRSLFADDATVSNNIDVAIYYQSVSNNLGPQVQFETIKYSLKDASRLKFFKMFLMNYTSDQSMTVTVSGTNYGGTFPNTATGTAVTTVFPVNSTNSILKRVKFLIRAPQLWIRVYQTATPVASNSQRFKMFWYSIGGKFMRIGRAQ